MCRSLILLVCISFMTGCIATHRSNTAWFEENVHVGILEAPPITRTEGQDFTYSALGFAASLALKGAEAALKWEASKYAQDSTGDLKEANLGNLTHLVSPEGWVLSNHGGGADVPSAYITILRTVTPKSQLGFWESVWRTLFWFERPTQLEILNDDFVGKLIARVKKYNHNLMQRDDDTIRKAFGLEKITGESFLSFAAVLQITPTAPLVGHHYPNYRIELLDYRYSSLKAKNLSWVRVPFTGWEETKSILTVSLKGSKADMRLMGNQYEGKADFEVQWNRELSSDKKASEWANQGALVVGEGKPLAKSPPIHTYDFRNFGVSIKLSEAGLLKEAFESASKKVTEIDVKELLKK